MDRGRHAPLRANRLAERLGSERAVRGALGAGAMMSSDVRLCPECRAPIAMPTWRECSPTCELRRVRRSVSTLRDALLRCQNFIGNLTAPDDLYDQVEAALDATAEGGR